MAKAKKDKKDSNLLVILLMLVLVMLIALPPIFRMLFPKEEESKNSSDATTQKANKLTSLSCRKTSSDGFNITINTIYKNNDVSRLTLSYIASVNNDANANNATTQNGEVTQEQPVVDNNMHQVEDNTVAEIEILKAIPNIKVNENGNSHQFQIEMKNFTYKTIPDDLTLRVQSLSLQRAFYENAGYICSIMNNQ